MAQLLLIAGADIKALDLEHHCPPESWARVAIEVTNNVKCAEVAAYLSEAEGALAQVIERVPIARAF